MGAASTRLKIFDPEELALVREDYRRTNHNLSMVAQLHGCHKADIIAALGLTEDESPRKSPGKAGWEVLNPELAERFYAAVEAGTPMAVICREVGIKHADTGFVIFNRMRARRAIMANTKKQTTKQQDEIITKAAVAATAEPDKAEPVQPEDYTPEAEKDIAWELGVRIKATGEVIEWLQELRVLSNDDTHACDRIMALASAACAGVEYAAQAAQDTHKGERYGIEH